MNSVARLAAVNSNAGKISRNSTPKRTPATRPPASVPSRVVRETPRKRAHSAMTRNAPVERTVAWMNGGISGSASLMETWLRPQESVSASMISAATASSGREVEGVTKMPWRIFFFGHPGRAQRAPGSITTNSATMESAVVMGPGSRSAASGMTLEGSCLPAMPAHAGDLDHAALRRKPRALRRRIEAVGDGAGRRLADRAAALTDEEHHRRIGRVIVDAGEERVAAFNAMHEALGGEEVERAIDRDRGGARTAGRDEVDDLVGAERLVAGAEHLEHVTAHRGQALAAFRAQRLGMLERIGRAALMVVVRGGKNGAHGVNSIRFRSAPRKRGSSAKTPQDLDCRLRGNERNGKGLTFILQCSNGATISI